jgi:hypothetical protein
LIFLNSTPAAKFWQGPSDRPAVTVSDLRRNLVALFSPRLKVIIRKFGKLAPLKLLAASERRGLVSEPRQIELNDGLQAEERKIVDCGLESL